ncbi:hypothetical protein C8Q80DRAFT_1107202 [Daedaleopsis nitida]|nr:hypothetical protein C8Q80DRAFT_1107202 [Daedaleopsis nitida]
MPQHSQLYRLCGIIYFAPSHFVSRVIDKNGEVWYNDGITTKETFIYCGNIITISSDFLYSADTYKASILIYTRL